MVQEFRGSRYFQIVDEVDSYKPIERAMDRRRVLVGVAIPYDYSRNLSAGKEAPVQILLDGSRFQHGVDRHGLRRGLGPSLRRTRPRRCQSMRAGSVLQPPVNASVRVWYNPDLVSPKFYRAGADRRDYHDHRGATDVADHRARMGERHHGAVAFDTGSADRDGARKAFAHFLLGLVDMLIALFVGVVIFGVPLKGSWVLLLFSACVFLYGALAWGLYISAMFRNQLAAYQMGTLTSFLPAFLLSGFIYPLSNMPWIIRVISLSFQPGTLST